MTTYEQSPQLLLDILDDLGAGVHGDQKILDFGCGRGQLVAAFCERGLDAWGTDIKPYWEGDSPSPATRLSAIAPDSYNLPFDDESFDLVFSTSVFEHVQNYQQSFAEIHRVFKPGGNTIHIFPDPWVLPVEPHMFVPFASVVHFRWWFLLWAFLGIRNSFQYGKPWREVADLNYAYAQSGIHYEPRAAVKRMVCNLFGDVVYPSKSYLAHSPGGAAKLGRKISTVVPLPYYDKLLFSVREQVIFATKRATSAMDAK